MECTLLNQLIQCFFSGCLDFCLKPEDINNMTWDCQERFLNLTVNSELLKKYPISTEFTRLFFKKLIQFLEPNQEVHDTFYTHLCTVMNKSNGSFSYRHYIVGEDMNNIITIKETRNMVVNGTTGMKTWEAALILSDWALCNKDKFNNKNVLELGSGVGFTGITIGRLCNVKSLIFSDCHDDVLKTACENIKINFQNHIEEKVHNCIIYKNKEHALGVMLLDWNHAEDMPETLVPDVVIGADIIYDPSILQPLCNIIRKLSNRNQNVEVYIASIVRNQDTSDSFLSILNQTGLTYQIIDLAENVYIKWEKNVNKCLLQIKLQL